MSLRDEIKAYTDGNGYVIPNVSDGSLRGSDNGTCFTSEYYMMLYKRHEDNLCDPEEFEIKIRKSMVETGLLGRAPGALGEQDGPDNQYAVLAACKVLGLQQLAENIYKYGMNHYGFFNSECPGTFRNKAGKINWRAFLWRQPQMVAAAISASGNFSRWKLWQLPFYIVAAVTIATSGISAPLNDSDTRRLCWSLIQSVTPDSFICRLAAKLWYNRLYKQYGPYGMREVAERYYQQSHPFKHYWVD